VSVRKKIGESAGLTFRNDGGVDMVGGSCFVAAAIAEFTSWGRGVDVAVEGKLDGDAGGAPGLRARSSGRCPRSSRTVSRGASLPLRPWSPGSPRKLCRDLDRGEIDVGQRRNRQEAVARQSENQIPAMTSTVMTGRRTKSSDRFMNEDSRLDHDLRPAPRRSWPCVTTCSPFSRPSR